MKHGHKGIGKGSQLTRLQIMQGSDWNEDNGWRASEQKEQDEMAIDQMFCEPVLPPKGENILKTIWSYVQEPDKKKARNF